MGPMFPDALSTRKLTRDHIGGVGILRDLGGGADRYLAIRNYEGLRAAPG